MPQKVYLNILKYGVYLSLISVFLVFRNMLFPYITSKQIYFNILIEILFAFWLTFLIKYPEYRPKKNYISFGLLAFFAAMLLSLITSVDVNLSFWGDIERMLGVFHLLHFLALYFIIITAFRSWRDWQVLYIVSIIFALFVSIKSLPPNQSFSTIGNTAYVSAYLIFNMYFSFILFFREPSKLFRWLYIIPFPMFLYSFKLLNTTGAFVGLGASIIALFFLYGILAKNKNIKIATFSIFVLTVALGSLLYINRKSDYIINNSVLNFVTEVDFNKPTFQTRLISWRAAGKDFLRHPILGVGHGNYAVIFDKYFDPKFYNYTASETYFDRAHNNLIDIGSTTGLVGLLSYLSIFAALAYYLIRGYRQDKISIHEFVIISSLIIAYFVQNLAVFDSLVTYIGLMITLAYVYWLTQEREAEPQAGNGRNKKFLKSLAEDRGFDNKEIYTFFIAGIIMIIIMYQYNIKVYKMLDLTIKGQIYSQQGQVLEMIDTYKKALNYNTVLDRDSRTSLIRVFAGGPDLLSKMDKDKRQEIFDFVIDLAKKNVDYNPEDSLNMMLYSQVLNIAASLSTDNPEKYAYYSDQAMTAIDKSIAASPGRVPIYFQKAQIYITRGEQDKALEVLKQAYELNPIYPDSSCYLARTMFFYKQEKEAYQYMDSCIDYGGQALLSPSGFVQSLINHYVGLKDNKRILILQERLTQLEPDNIRFWIDLSKLYADNGDKEKAKNAAEQAIRIDPNIKQYAEQFIQSLEK